MRRFSIARLMIAVAFLAANFAAIRHAMLPAHDPQPVWEVVIGYLPMADALLMTAYLLFGRNRLSIRRRPAGEAGRTALTFLVVGSGMLLLAAVFGVWARDPLNALLPVVAGPL